MAPQRMRGQELQVTGCSLKAVNRSSIPAERDMGLSAPGSLMWQEKKAPNVWNSVPNTAP